MNKEFALMGIDQLTAGIGMLKSTLS